MGDIIDDLIQREGAESDDHLDAGGRTKYGISERGNPDLWKNGPPTYEQARQRFEDRYVKAPGFDKVLDPQLRVQLIDFGVTSGPAIAIQNLQKVVGVTVDGVIGPATLAAVANIPVDCVCNRLVAERVKLIGRIAQRNPSQVRFLCGWLNRALEFLAT